MSGGSRGDEEGLKWKRPLRALTSCPHRGPRPAELLLLWFILHPSSLPSPHHRAQVCPPHLRSPSSSITLLPASVHLLRLILPSPSPLTPMLYRPWHVSCTMAPPRHHSFQTANGLCRRWQHLQPSPSFLLFSSFLIPFGEKSILLGLQSKCCSGKASVSGGAGGTHQIKNSCSPRWRGYGPGNEILGAGAHSAGYSFLKMPKSTVIGWMFACTGVTNCLENWRTPCDHTVTIISAALTLTCPSNMPNWSTGPVGSLAVWINQQPQAWERD